MVIYLLLFCVLDVYMSCDTTRYDELHPSEQADRIVARNIADGILGIPSRWFTWIS